MWTVVLWTVGIGLASMILGVVAPDAAALIATVLLLLAAVEVECSSPNEERPPWVTFWGLTVAAGVLFAGVSRGAPSRGDEFPIAPGVVLLLWIVVAQLCWRWHEDRHQSHQYREELECRLVELSHLLEQAREGRSPQPPKPS
jgi:hypothetical protein